MARHRKLTQKFAGFPMFKLATSGDTFPLTSPFTSEFVGLDGLALDLQFATDKSLTARKGPTPAFTRASSATFVGSNGLIQSAGNNVARFDHDPVTLACKGLLIEESRTNLLQRSEEFNNAYWVKFQMQLFGSGSIANTTETFAPDGSNNADKLVENTVTDRHQIGDVGPATTVGTYTYSIFVKKPAGSAVSHIMVVFGGVAAAGVAATSLNLITLGIGDTLGGSNLNSSAIQYPNGWINLRCTVTTTVAGALNPNILFSRNGLFVNRSYTGDGTSGVYLWGAQLEAGSFPTSYIPTTTASVVRSADVCSISGSAFSGFYNQTEGSLACNYAITAGFTGNRYAASIEDTAGGTQNGFVFGNTNSASSFIAGSGYISTIGSITTVVSKHILAYTGLTEFVYVKDGVVGTVTGSGTRNPSLPISMSIGSLEGGFTACGHIASVRYFKKRLPNAKLQSITV